MITFLRIMTFRSVFLYSFFAGVTVAYIPAYPTNDTSVLEAATNQTGLSSIELSWFPNGFVANIFLFLSI